MHHRVCILRTMREVNRVGARNLRATAVSGAVCLAILCASACGGGTGGLSGDVIARVGTAPITKSALGHWMSGMLGGDYFDVTSRVAPAGLLAPPPGFTTCVTKLKAIAPKTAGKPRLTEEQLRSRCEQLYDAIKEQALNFLINAQVNISQGAANGVRISSGEVDATLKRVRAEQFPRAGELQKYLAQRHQSLADERFLLTLDLLNQKAHPRILRRLMQGGGGRQALAKRFAAYTARVTAQTDCRPGYVVARCRQYQPKDDKPYRGRAPASLLFEIGRWQPATSHSFTGPPTGARDILCRNVGKGVSCVPVGRRRTHR